MNDKELQDWQELILHDELNKLDTMSNGMTWDGLMSRIRMVGMNGMLNIVQADEQRMMRDR